MIVKRFVVRMVLYMPMSTGATGVTISEVSMIADLSSLLSITFIMREIMILTSGIQKL